MKQSILEWKIRSLGLGLVHKQDIAKGRGLELKVNVFKICVKFYCGGAVKKLMYQQTEGWRRGHQPPEAMADFLKIFVIFEKQSYFNGI